MLFIVLVLSSMFLIPNTIYFTLSLLVVTCYVVFRLVSYSIIQSLTGVILLLVYLGAIMILIGYICAVSPNFITVKFAAPSLVLLLVSSFGVLLPIPFSFEYSRVTSPLSFFFRRFGVHSFTVIAVILFITLLIVTSQYFSPKGPFRSVS